MGCVHSESYGGDKGSKPGPGEKKTVRVTEGAKKRRKRPSRISVAIRVGSGIRKSRVHAAARKTVCIFGGPKSGKGRVIEELVESFGVRVISAESLILASLPKVLSNPNTDGKKMETAQMLSQLRAHPEAITIDWIFELIKTEIQKYPDTVHVIDLLPNSKAILRDKTLFDNAAEYLAKFEESCPIAFALHLYLDKTNLAKQLEQLKKISTPDNCAVAPGGIQDEADSSATKKRHAVFEQAFSSIEQYFKSSDRLVEVDTSSNSHERIWYKLVQMFASFQLSERQNNNLIVIFTTGTEQMKSLIAAKIRVIKLTEIVDEPEGDFEEMMECLLYQISELGCPDVCYIVDVAGSTVERAAEFERRKCLIYKIQKPTRLSAFVTKYTVASLKERDDPEAKDWNNNTYVGFKAPNNLTLLFSPEFDQKGAEVISTTYCSMDKH